MSRLASFVADTDELWLGAGSAICPEVLGEPLGCQTDHAVCRSQDGLCGAVVPIERDNIGRRAELVGKVEDVPYCRGAEGVDRLRVVTDHGEPTAGRLETQQDR